MLIDYKLKILPHTLATEAEAAFDNFLRIHQWQCFHVEGLCYLMSNKDFLLVYIVVVQR